MKLISAQDIKTTTSYSAMVESLRGGFQSETKTPLRQQYQMKRSDGEEDVLLLMPSWMESEYGGVKIVNVVPGNAQRQLPAVAASYLLFSMKTGEHLAIIDGAELTSMRTACASALAADYLARRDASSLFVIGTGQVGKRVPLAYQAVRDIRKVYLWDINDDAAQSAAEILAADGIDAEVVSDVESTVAKSDIVSCATLSNAPLIDGNWLRPGMHLDLIGSFTPDMREADNTAISRSTVFIDTDAALEESGDMITPITEGVLKAEDIGGDLFSLCRGSSAGRTSQEEITLFKAVGTALEDLAAAKRIYEEIIARDGGD